MFSIQQIFYVSKAKTPYDTESVQRILRVSRRNNARHDITGCLLFSGSYFAQVLEGREAVVHELLQHIATDPRHAQFRVLGETRRETRAYADWSMGYLHDLGLEDDIEALLLGSGTQPAIADVMAKIRPDTVMGALR